MSFESKINCIGTVEFPGFTGCHTYMHRFELQDLRLPNGLEHWLQSVRSLLDLSPVKKGTAYITIDEKSVMPGETHRRGGAHIDGNHDDALMDTPEGPWSYDTSDGGMLIASSFPACKAWLGVFEGVPAKGGDCSHLSVEFDSKRSIVLDPNKVYLTNSSCVHESLPVKSAINRSLVRITLPPVKVL